MNTAATRFVLVETSHPGNIGGVARAMKTMGLARLHLVAPRSFPDPEATQRAAGADDILVEAVCHDTLSDAVADCALVIGTTARERSIEWPLLTPAQAARRLTREGHDGPTAIVFGRERNGLTNNEMELCHAMVRIPTEGDYSSLNLASAAQILAYEIRLAVGRVGSSPRAAPAANSDAMSLFYQHLEETLHDLDFVKTKHPPVKLMRKLVRLFNRARPSDEELNILRGILAAAQAAVRQKS